MGHVDDAHQPEDQREAARDDEVEPGDGEAVQERDQEVLRVVDRRAERRSRTCRSSARGRAPRSPGRARISASSADPDPLREPELDGERALAADRRVLDRAHRRGRRRGRAAPRAPRRTAAGGRRAGRAPGTATGRACRRPASSARSGCRPDRGSTAAPGRDGSSTRCQPKVSSTRALDGLVRGVEVVDREPEVLARRRGAPVEEQVELHVADAQPPHRRPRSRASGCAPSRRPPRRTGPTPRDPAPRC